jgi:mannose-6-phosphate isomerase-like protein (cupin superfamily)
MHVRSYAEIQPSVTLDGSEIREWAGRVSEPAQNQSLAEATIPVGGATTEHYHRVSEELYLVTAGRGRLIIDGEEPIIGVGDCALIAPGARHKLFNVGAEPCAAGLRLLTGIRRPGHVPDGVSVALAQDHRRPWCCSSSIARRDGRSRPTSGLRLMRA